MRPLRSLFPSLGAGLAALAAAVTLTGASLPGPAAAERVTPTTALNLRSGPGVRYRIIDVLVPGEVVNLRFCRASGWCYVTRPGPDGWVAGRFLALAPGVRPAKPGCRWTVAVGTGGSGFAITCRANGGTVVVRPPRPAPPPPPTPAIKVRTDLRLSPGARVDADTGALIGGTAADFQYRNPGRRVGTWELKALNGARFSAATYASRPNHATCAAAPKTRVYVTLSSLRPQKWVCLRTNAGRIGFVRYDGLGRGGRVDLRLVTWR